MYYNIDWEKTKEKVRWMMKERNYTLKKMASDLYMSESSVKNYIYGKSGIPTGVLLSMVDIFGKDKIEDILAFLDD